MPELDSDVLQSVCAKATVSELKSLCKCFGTVKKMRLPDNAQLLASQEDDDANHAFQI